MSSSLSNIISKLKQYDTNNDGFISYNEFISMCEKTQINETNTQRSIWKQLGGDPDDINSKISVHDIAAQTPKVCFCSFPKKLKRALLCSTEDSI